MVDTIEIINPNDDIDVIEIGVPGADGTGVTGPQLADIFNRLAALEAKLPPGIVISGKYYGGLSTVGGVSESYNRYMEANALHAVPFNVPADATFDQMAIYVEVAGSAGAKVRMGIYESPSGAPATRLYDLGTIDVTGTGTRTTPISISLARGRYFLAGASNQQIQVRAYRGPGTTSMFGHNLSDGSQPLSAVKRSTDLSSGFSSLPTPFGSYIAGVGVFTFLLRAS